MSRLTPNQTLLAAGLELGPGLVLQTFGVGHLYAGQVGSGLAWMFSYWVLQAINVALMTVWIGFITWPLTLLLYLVLAPTDVLRLARE